jgi:hydrogenase maturation protein HypF
MADTILHQALTLKKHYPYAGVGLTGGVFQNRLISERAIDRLGSIGIPGYLHRQVPCNDGGLSYGQIIAACHA